MTPVQFPEHHFLKDFVETLILKRIRMDFLPRVCFQANLRYPTFA